MDEQAFRDFKEKVCSGDNSVFESVFEECAQYCIRVLIKNTGCSYDDASDLFMDAMLNLREKILQGKVSYMSSLRAYLYKTSWNMWRDQRRKEDRIRRDTELIKRDYYHLSGQFEDPLVELELKSEQAEQFSQKLEATQKTLKELSEKCQKILTLFYMQRRSMQEIADQLEFASSDVAKTLKSRCYKRWMEKINLLL